MGTINPRYGGHAMVLSERHDQLPTAGLPEYRESQGKNNTTFVAWLSAMIKRRTDEASRNTIMKEVEK